MGTERKTLSLCMIVKNEEKSLARCLQSVQNLADEIIVTDTGSTDKTVEVAKKFKASVFNFPWKNNFAEARNFSLAHCNSDYVLYLDADEELPPDSVEKIKEILDSEEQKAFLCKIKNIDEFSGRTNFGTYCRLFPNVEGIQFRGRVHEQIEDSLKEARIEIVDSEIEIVHYGYNIDDERKAQKATRNLPLLLEEFEESSSSYYAYQLGLTYSILEDYRNAEIFFNHAVKANDLADDYKVFSLQFLINFALKRKDYSTAKKLAEEIFEFNIIHPSVYYIVAKVYAVLGNFEKALMYCSTAFEMNSTPFGRRKINLVFEKLNDEEIIYYGIYLSLLADSEKYFEHFIEKLSTELNRRETGEVLKKLKRQEKISAEEENLLIKNLNKYSADAVTRLLQDYRYVDEYPHLLPSLYEKFGDSSTLLIAFAEYLVRKGETNTAISLLESRLNDFPDNPAPAFYLISLYVKVNDLEKLLLPLDFLEKNFANAPEVFNGLQQINNELFQAT